MADFRSRHALDLGGVRLSVFPILMGQHWQRAPTQVCSPLVRGVELAHIPMVAPVYLIDEAGPGGPAPSRAYLREERLAQLGWSRDELMAEAMWNLARRKLGWDTGALRKLGVVSASEDYLAAERILDPAFLALAQRLIGEETLAVGIPARGRLYATSLTRLMSDPAHAQAFTGVLRHIFEQAGETAISPWPYVAVNGSVSIALEVTG